MSSSFQSSNKRLRSESPVPSERPRKTRRVKARQWTDPILAHIMEVTLPEMERYADFLLFYDSKEVVNQAYQWISEGARAFVAGGKYAHNPEKIRDVDALKSIGGDISTQSIGWYMNIITDDDDNLAGLYVGQALSLWRRIGGKSDCHIRSKHRRRSLHHSVWDQPGRSNQFVLLGTLSEDEFETDDRNNVLNIMEHFFALVFQTLQPATLRKYLPSSIELVDDGARLNLALPLHQGDPEASKRAIAELANSTDPEKREYYQRRLQEGGAGAQAGHRAEDHASLRDGVRAASTNFNVIYRAPNKPEEENVLVKCFTCGNVRVDKYPKWEIVPAGSVSRYVTDVLPCYVCYEKEGKRAKSNKTTQTKHHPVYLSKEQCISLGTLTLRKRKMISQAEQSAAAAIANVQEEEGQWED